jgi:hypothetical protein
VNFVVVDSRTSAIGMSAANRILNQDFRILAADEFPSSSLLLHEIAKTDTTCVLFAWRRAWQEILDSPINRLAVNKLLGQTSVGILIPDFLGMDAIQFEIDLKLIHSSDFVMVTCKRLFDIYETALEGNYKPILFRDMPDVHAIKEVRKENSSVQEKRIIWVGNSKWGINQGKIDYKKFQSIIQPLMGLLPKGFELKVVDSALNPLSHLETLREIRKSQMLLQASTAEGTGLPLLEAAGLGAIPITTSVGIAPEFLTGSLRNLITEPTVLSFKNKILDISNDVLAYQNLLRERYVIYTDEILADRIPLGIKNVTSGNLKFNILKFIENELRWVRRWWLYKLKHL